MRKLWTGGALGLLALLAACGGGEQQTETVAPDNTTTVVTNPGEVLYTKHCTVCHGPQMKGGSMAPDLTNGLAERWPDQDKLKKFIRNSQEVIKSGDPYANELYKKWNGAQMTPFTNLSDQDLNDLINFILAKK